MKTTPLTAAQLAEVRNACGDDCLAEGPWTANCLGSEGYSVNGPARPFGRGNRSPRLALCTHEDFQEDRANAHFIAAARMALPALLAENAELRATLDRVDDLLATIERPWREDEAHDEEDTRHYERMARDLRVALNKWDDCPAAALAGQEGGAA